MYRTCPSRGYAGNDRRYDFEPFSISADDLLTKSVRAFRPDQVHGTAAEASTRHPGPINAFYPFRRLNKKIDFLGCDFIIVPHAHMGLVEELPIRFKSPRRAALTNSVTREFSVMMWRARRITTFGSGVDSS